MAKDIKAIECPHCGSIYKSEVKPDFYRCQNCGTEYYLDSDDKHIYYHHDSGSPVQRTPPLINNKKPVIILLFAFSFAIICYVIVQVLHSGRSSTSNNYVIKMPKLGFAWYLYTNTETGDPHYLRLYTDYISSNNNEQVYQIHAQTNNAATGELLHDRKMFSESAKSQYTFYFCSYPNNLIYAICDNTKLFQLDTKSDELTEVTNALFKNYPELGSGIAKLEFAYQKEIIDILSNDGKNYYYLPVTRQLLNNAAQVQLIEDKRLKARHFEFNSPDGEFGMGKTRELQEVKYTEEAHEVLHRNFTPGRTYFDPTVLYQDTNTLLIASRITAADESASSIQSIDPVTGKVLWALTPDTYFLSTCVKCKEGFAFDYRKDAAADYVHGAIVVSAQGKIVHDYQLKRTE